MTKEPCVHLNKLISEKGPHYENINTYVGNNIDKAYYESGAGLIIPPGISNRSYEFQFRRKMVAAGLEPIKVDILVLKYVYELSFREITDELGVTSLSTTVRLHEESLKILKKRGIPNEVD